MWTKPSFDRLVEQAKLYDIDIASFEAAEKGFGKKGGFRLEYLNGWTPPAPVAKKKGMPWWIWAVIGLIVAAIIVILCLPRKEKIVEVEKEVIKEVVIRDTVYMKQIEEIEANFNAAQFEVNKAELNDDAKIALHDLAQLMKAHSEIRLHIEGHTSAEGDAQFNQKLSQDRAQAAVDFLVNKEGIDPGRLTAVGKGSSEPIDPDKPELNRRTEFIIVK